MSRPKPYLFVAPETTWGQSPSEPPEPGPDDLLAEAAIRQVAEDLAAGKTTTLAPSEAMAVGERFLEMAEAIDEASKFLARPVELIKYRKRVEKWHSGVRNAAHCLDLRGRRYDRRVYEAVVQVINKIRK